MNKVAKIQAGATCVLVIVTIILAIFNIRLVKFTKKYAEISEKIAGYTKEYVEESKKYVTATRRMVDEMKKDRAERMRPFVKVCLAKEVQSYSLKIANLGGSPAFDIEVSLRPYLGMDIRIKRLWQKDEFLTEIGPEAIFTEKTRKFQVALRYKDQLGHSYMDTINLNLDFVEIDKDKDFLEIVEKAKKARVERLLESWERLERYFKTLPERTK